MTPEQIAAYATYITALGTLLAGVWAFLNNRALLREEREKRQALEKSTARREEFEHQHALIETLQKAMEASEKRHEEERNAWREERIEMDARFETERDGWRKEREELKTQMAKEREENKAERVLLNKRIHQLENKRGLT